MAMPVSSEIEGRRHLEWRSNYGIHRPSPWWVHGEGLATLTGASPPSDEAVSPVGSPDAVTGRARSPD